MSEHQICSGDNQSYASGCVVSSLFQCIMCNIEGRCSVAEFALVTNMFIYG